VVGEGARLMLRPVGAKGFVILPPKTTETPID
jgi:hypothetical protein